MSIEPEPSFDRLELVIVLVVAAFDILAEGVNKVRKVLDLVLSEHIRFDRIFVYRNRFFLFELDGTVFYFLKKVKQKLCLLFDTLDWFGFGSD